jgi:hypothetical protein
VNFTREPIVETVITPKDGYKLLIRNSKTSGQEEFFVDAVEVISFGTALFFRSLEKPKSFLVPVNDYEVLESRESRIILKTTGTERGIKIGGGKESPLKVQKEEHPAPEAEEGALELRPDKRRERRRSRKKRGKSDQDEENQEFLEEPPFPVGVTETSPVKEKKLEKATLIPPPSTLISETITRYKALHAAESEQEAKLTPSPLIPPPEPELVENEQEDEEIPF